MTEIDPLLAAQKHAAFCRRLRRISGSELLGKGLCSVQARM